MKIPTLRMGLTPKILLFPVLLCISFAVILFYFLHEVHTFSSSRQLIEIADQQRILNQQYMKQVLLNGQGLLVDYKITGMQLSESLKALQNGGEAHLENGTQTRISKVPFSKIRENLDAQTVQAQKLFQESQKYLQSLEGQKRKNVLLDELHKQGLTLQAYAEQTVQAYDKHLETGVPWWEVDALAVELAERQKMLIQQHVKEILLVSSGIPADYQASRIKLFDTISLLLEGGNLQLSDKETIPVPAPATNDIRFSLQNQKKELEKFTSISNEFLMLANRQVENSIELKRLSDISTAFGEIATNTSNMIHQAYAADLSRHSREAIFSGLLLFILGLTFLWQVVTRTITRPLQVIREAVDRLGEGDTAVSISKYSNDEIGSLAKAIDKASTQIQQKLQTVNGWVDKGMDNDAPFFFSHDRIGNALRDLANNVKNRSISVSSISSSSSDLIETSNNRISNFDLATDRAKIIGQLPNLNLSEMDQALLNQILARAKNFEGHQEQLLLVNEQLQEQTISLNASQARLKEAEEDLKNYQMSRTGDKSFTKKSKEEIEKYSEDIQSLNQRLSEQTEYLRESEERLMIQKEELASINQSLMKQTEQQARELRVLHDDLQQRSDSLQTSEKRLDETRHDLQRLEMQNQELVRLSARHLEEVTEKEAKLHKMTEELLRRENELNRLAVEKSGQSEEIQQLITVTHSKDGLISKKQSEVFELQLSLQQKEKLITELESNIKRYRLDYENLQNQISSEKYQSEAQKSALNSEFLKASERLSKIDSELNLERKKYDDLAIEISTKERALELARQEITKNMMEIRTLQAEVNRRQNYDEMQQRLKFLEQETIKNQADKRALQIELDRRQNYDEITRKTKTMENELMLVNQAYQDRLKEMDEIKSEAYTLKSKLNEKTQALESQLTENQRLEIRVKALDIDLKRGHDENRQYFEQIHTIKNELLSAQSNLQQCRESYQAQNKQLSAAEGRLKATRAALRASIDELQRDDNSSTPSSQD